VNRVDLDYLRRFRDDVLARSAPGRLAIALYGTTSPVLARVVARSALARAAADVVVAPAAHLARFVIDRRSYARYRGDRLARRVVAAVVAAARQPSR
jgi:hypothetical protein